MLLRKDSSLDYLANRGNVAQFVSFAPKNGELLQQYCRVSGYSPNHRFESLPTALENLLRASSERTVNVRSYAPTDPRSKEFVYGIGDVREAIAVAQRLCAEN